MPFDHGLAVATLAAATTHSAAAAHAAHAAANAAATAARGSCRRPRCHRPRCRRPGHRRPRRRHPRRRRPHRRRRRIAAPRAAAARAAADCVAADRTTADRTTADRAAAIPQPPPLPAPYPSYNQTTRSGPSGHSPGVAREWGSNPHPTTPPPPSTRAHPACRPGLETVGRGEGGRHSSPGAGQRERGPPNSSLGRYTPPTHIGAGRRPFRRTPSNTAIFTVLGRAPQAASFIGSRRVWVRHVVERRRGLRQSLASQVSPRCGYVPLI